MNYHLRHGDVLEHPKPCALDYYGTDCKGCTAHPRGLTVKAFREARIQGGYPRSLAKNTTFL